MSVGALVLRAITKSFGAVPVLRALDLTLEGGRLLALLGPSGCGKTTLLRLIAGFERPDTGSIDLDGRPLAGPGAFVPAHRRGIGLVPQDGALFPHLSVADNIGFGLERADRASRVAAMLDLVGLPGLDRRLPHALSGGQQQRVALARALAPNPRLILLDEPFNALDAALRHSLCTDVRLILKRSDATAILVTHDRDEAFSMADQVAVMRQGRIRQVGTPRDVYDNPVDLASAALVGAAVCLPGRLDGDRVATCLGKLAVANPGRASAVSVTVLLRPEQIVPAPAGAGVKVAVVARTFLGPLVWLTLLTCDDHPPVSLRACYAAALDDGVSPALAVTVRGTARVFDNVATSRREQGAGPDG